MRLVQLLANLPRGPEHGKQRKEIEENPCQTIASTAAAVECVDRAAFNAKQAATIPTVCKILPAGIERRAKTLRFMVSAGFSCPPFQPQLRQTCPDSGLPEVRWRMAPTLVFDFT